MPLLLESGDYLLLESGDRLLLEDESAGTSATVTPSTVAVTTTAPAATPQAGATVTQTAVAVTSTVPSASAVTVIEPRLSSTIRMGAP